MWNGKSLSPSLARRPRERRPIRGRPSIEALEGRTLLSLNFSAGYEILGTGVTVSQVATDAQGNAYVAGYYYGRADFGKDAGGNDYQKNNDGTTDEAFVVKYSPTGTLDWFTQFEPQANDPSAESFADSLVVDGANQTVYVVGTFTGPVDFDPFGRGDVETTPTPTSPTTATSSASARRPAMRPTASSMTSPRPLPGSP